MTKGCKEPELAKTKRMRFAPSFSKSCKFSVPGLLLIAFLFSLSSPTATRKPSWRKGYARQRHHSKMAVSRHLGYYRTGNSTIRSADPENCSLEPNVEWIGCTDCEIFAFKVYCNLETGVRSHSRSSKAAPLHQPTPKPDPRSKHDVDWHYGCEVVAFFVCPRWPSAAILDFIEPQIAPFDPPTPKTVA